MMKSSNTGQDTDLFALDSNILLYAFDRSEGKKHEVCAELLDAGFRGDVSFFVPSQVLSEFYSVICRGRLDMRPEDAQEIIRYIVGLPNFVVRCSDEYTVIEAIDLNRRFKVHFWDAMILSVMKTNFVTKIYTENIKDFQLPWISALDLFSER